jgi:hypothetical protein
MNGGHEKGSNVESLQANCNRADESAKGGQAEARMARKIELLLRNMALLSCLWRAREGRCLQSETFSGFSANSNSHPSLWAPAIAMHQGTQSASSAVATG